MTSQVSELKSTMETLDAEKHIHIFRIVRLHHNNELVTVEKDGSIYLDLNKVSTKCLEDIKDYIVNGQDPIKGNTTRINKTPQQNMSVLQQPQTKCPFTREEETYLARCVPKTPTLLQKRVLKRGKDLKCSSRFKRATDENEDLPEDEQDFDDDGQGDGDDAHVEDTHEDGEDACSFADDEDHDVQTDLETQDDQQEDEVTEAEDDETEAMNVADIVGEAVGDVVVNVPDALKSVSKETLVDRLQLYMSTKGHVMTMTDTTEPPVAGPSTSTKNGGGGSSSGGQSSATKRRSAEKAKETKASKTAKGPTATKTAKGKAKTG